MTMMEFDDIGFIAQGHYTDQYFLRTSELIWAQLPDVHVKMQIFQKNHAVLGGMSEVQTLLQDCCYGALPETHAHSSSLLSMEPGHLQLDIRALEDGMTIEPWEPVMTIAGPYRLFAHLETVYLGILARRTLVRTNCQRVMEAANGKPVIFMAARHEHWVNQAGDGHEAHLAGMQVATAAQASGFEGREVGTIPHSLIAAFGGDTVKAALAYACQFPDEPVTTLVDFDNDCAHTAVEVAEAFRAVGLKLAGVRLDTGEKLIDEGVEATTEMDRWMDHGDVYGVCPRLVRLVREGLNAKGFEDVKIIVSGGFTEEKIQKFERLGVPVDVYGVGSSLLRGSNDFTADIVRVNGEPCAKVGRQEIDNPRLRSC